MLLFGDFKWQLHRWETLLNSEARTLEEKNKQQNKCCPLFFIGFFRSMDVKNSHKDCLRNMDTGEFSQWT